MLLYTASLNSNGSGGSQPPTVPDAPTNLSASVNSNIVTFTWNKSYNATSYNLYKTDGTLLNTFGDVNTAQSIFINGTYNVVLRAVNSEGESIDSNIVTFTINVAIVISDASRILVPDTPSSDNPAGTGFTCTGLAYDEEATIELNDPTKVVFWIGSDGRVTQDNSTAPFHGLIVKAAFDITETSNDYTPPMPTMTWLDEIDLTTLEGFAREASVQGLAIDKRGWLWATQFRNLVCVDSKTKQLIGVTYRADGWQGLAYDWQNDRMYVSDTKNTNPRVVSLWDIDTVNGKLILNNQNFCELTNGVSVDIISMTKNDNQSILASIGSVGYKYDLNGNQIRGYNVGGTNIQTEGLTIIDGYFYIVSDAYYHPNCTPHCDYDVNAIHKIKI